MTNAKDNRTAFNGQRIECNGNVVSFDGKWNPTTRTLKVYRYYGDITIMEQAIAEFCIDRGYA